MWGADMEDIMKKSDRIIVSSIILVLSLVLVGTAAAANPAVRVTKEPATQTVKPGDPASFTFTVTNTGDVELTPIMVLDYINGVKVPECCKNFTGLKPGELTSYTCSHGGETASYTNIVSAFAWSPVTGTSTRWNDSAEVTVIPNAIPVINVKIVPKTINLGSKGYFLAFVTLPEAYKGATIDMKTVSCSGSPAVRMMKLKIFPRMVGFVFKTSELNNVEVGKRVTLNVEGELKNMGSTYTFTGSDDVKVISKPSWQPDDIKDVSKESDEQLFKKFTT
jgi:uncharacterized repeat protein (TIGR01451 family)